MKDKSIMIENDLLNMVVGTVSVKSRCMSSYKRINNGSEDIIILPNGKVRKRLDTSISWFTVKETEVGFNLKIWANGYDMFYSINSVNDWHVEANYPEHMVKIFHLTSLDNGEECEVWYLFKFTEDLSDELFDLGGEITVLWIGEIINLDNLTLKTTSQKIIIEFGHGFGVFFPGMHQRYKKLYEAIRSLN